MHFYWLCKHFVVSHYRDPEPKGKPKYFDFIHLQPVLTQQKLTRTSWNYTDNGQSCRVVKNTNCKIKLTWVRILGWSWLVRAIGFPQVMDEVVFQQFLLLVTRSHCIVQHRSNHSHHWHRLITGPRHW